MHALRCSMRRALHGQAAKFTVTPLVEANFPLSPLDLRKFGLQVYPEFISLEEEEALAKDSRAHLYKQPYEAGHWDAVIMDYREIQRPISQMSGLSQEAITRALKLFPAGTTPLPTLHALELKPHGKILAHVDSIKFSGGVVAGLCLLSHACLQLTPDVGGVEEGRAPSAAAAAQHTTAPCISIHLPPRTFYMLTGEARYGWGHAVPSDTLTVNGEEINRDTRISVMLRDELPSLP